MASWLDTALSYLQDNKSEVGLLTGIAGMTGLLDNFTGAKNTGPRGYQGSIPDYTATRSRVPNTYDPTRRPGSGGQRYFTDTQFIPKVEGETPAVPMSAEGLAALNLANPARQTIPQTPTQGVSSVAPVTTVAPAAASGVANLLPVPTYENGGEVSINLGDLDTTAAGARQMGTPQDYIKYQNAIKRKQDAYFNKPEEERSIEELQEILTMQNMLKSGFYGAMGNRFGDEDKFYKGMEELTDMQAKYFRGMANGGLAELAKGRYLRSSSDGMADKIPATIDKTQPAALSGGEYVIPADVVSHLGNGNSDAGAKVLDKMMERIRKTRTGNGKQGKEIDPNKLLPA